MSRFYLTTETHHGRQYYRESGTINVGTEGECQFVNWTNRRSDAFGFKTAKAAQAMLSKLATFGVEYEVIKA